MRECGHPECDGDQVLEAQHEIDVIASNRSVGDVFRQRQGLEKCPLVSMEAIQSRAHGLFQLFNLLVVADDALERDPLTWSKDPSHWRKDPTLCRRINLAKLGVSQLTLELRRFDLRGDQRSCRPRRCSPCSVCIQGYGQVLLIARGSCRSHDETEGFEIASQEDGRLHGSFGLEFRIFVPSRTR